MDNNDVMNQHEAAEIAIIGLAGHFPKARNVEQFWQNLKDGMEAISFFSDEELQAAGVDAAHFNAPNYVRAKAILEDVELFDAAFFDYNPREAEMLDPQHRMLMECAVEAFDNAGYDPASFKGRVGVYAGVSGNSYLSHHLRSRRDLIERVGEYQVDLGNHGEFLPTSISFKLNLRGPSINVQTACSTSLVAVHVACQSLLNGECDMALAGGGSITFPHKAGYLYQEGGILAPDGHCRAFDAEAKGTVGGEGVGLVVLKRLVDALADGDTIQAIIKGSAVNNDGALKVGYTAPSVDGQAEVIADALAMAGVEAETVTYVETHGTGTTLGDPIEVAALTQAFRTETQKKQFSAIGSLKTNIGHLDVAAGIASLIKTVLSLKHRQLPSSLHYQHPNPKIDFTNSPFYVNTKLTEWKAGPSPRRAGVSSFGIGGTNAHVILEEAPLVELETQASARSSQLLVLSAKTDSALDAATRNLGEYLKKNGEANLADLAYTLQVGRKGYAHRRILVCREASQAALALETLDSGRLLTRFHEPGHHPVLFMFPGQGAQYVNMSLGLYRTEQTFREHVDFCAELLTQHLGLDLRELLYPASAQSEEAGDLLNQTYLTQPAIFTVEYALARLWNEWGVRPEAMIGHSIGEYVAACLAGVFTLEDALKLVAARGRLMQQLPGGSMLSVLLPEREVRSLVPRGLSLAAVNGPNSCVVSGPPEVVKAFQEQLHQRGLDSRLLHTSHAFHSEMTEPILETFTQLFREVKLSAPQIPFISNVTGNWINATQATDPGYWARHLRQTVRFNDGLGELLKEPGRILLEVGPGQTLSSLAKLHPSRSVEQTTLTSLRHPRDQHSDEEFLLAAVGQLWLAGSHVDWAGFYTHEQRQRVPLPSYPFERQRYYIDPQGQPERDATLPVPSKKNPDIAEWFYLPSWKRVMLPSRSNVQERQRTCWLIFVDEHGVGLRLAERLAQRGEDVIRVSIGDFFARVERDAFTINPARKDDYQALFRELGFEGRRPEKIAHLWSVTASAEAQPTGESFERFQLPGLYSLLFLAQALAKDSGAPPLQLTVITDNIQEVSGEEVLRPEKATILGACKVIPQEYPHIVCRTLDLVVPAADSAQHGTLIEHLLNELGADASEKTIAYRGKHRWVQSFEALRWETSAATQTPLRQGGVYLITGGLGGVGLSLAQHLAERVKAKLVLVGRNVLPHREEWERWLAEHDGEEQLSRKIRRVQRLEAAGAEVMLAQADVSSEEQMSQVMAQAEQRFGVIHGIIHGAATGGENADKEIAETGPFECQQQFQPKAHGLLVLEKICGSRRLDFCLLLSSLSSVLGGLTFTAYAAANIFMDTFAHWHNRTSSDANWISVNWDAWNLGPEREEAKGLGSGLAELALTPAQGGEALERILSMGPIIQVVVSTGDLQGRLGRWVTLAATKESEPTRKLPAAALHHRPNLPSAYVSPTNELEQEIAEIWQELLGIAPIGVNDNFFDLGGHSLLATMALSRLRKVFGVELPLQGFFTAPTVGDLALAVARSVIEQQDDQQLAELLEELDQARKRAEEPRRVTAEGGG